MRVIGSIEILIAALLGWGAYNYSTAASLKGQIGRQTGLTKFVGEGLGLNNIDRLRIRQIEDTGQKLAIGAAIVGFVGLLLCSGGGASKA
jgi:hypothetical protein